MRHQLKQMTNKFNKETVNDIYIAHNNSINNNNTRLDCR